jgi:hippurate hydrolase
MAMVLGAAAVLSANGRFDGTVRVIFQPAEEPGRGAQAMLDDGLLDAFPIDALYGLHNLPGVPAGHLHTPPGAIMASEDNFEIVVTGRGGHAARPHLVVDPLVVGAEIVLALQTVVASTVNPVQPAVLSCTEFHIDGAHNASPDGLHHWRHPQLRPQCPGTARATHTRHHIAAAHGATCTVEYTHEFAPSINDASRTRVAAAAAVQALSADHVDDGCDPIMPSEDFGIFARHVPACFALIGNGTAEGHGGTALHSRTYDANDDILEAGVSYYLEVIRSELPTR